MLKPEKPNISNYSSKRLTYHPNSRGLFSASSLESSSDFSVSKIRNSILGLIVVAAALATLILNGCSGSTDAEGETSGPAFQRPPLALSQVAPGVTIDTSSLSQGFVGASCISDSRLKFQVIFGGNAYNYDLPNDGTPIVCPLSMGNGSYTFQIMQNTSGNRYVELQSITQSVSLNSQFDPFIRPNIFSSYTASSRCVQMANDLTSAAENQGDVLAQIYTWIVSNITYDTQKAASVTTGYIPNPDSTIASGNGICFDYASLAAAMLRSQGIPCKIITGDVSPDNIYHAWNEVYIDGTWVTIGFTISPGSWQRIDTTFAAGGDTSTVGDGSNYMPKYTY